MKHTLFGATLLTTLVLGLLPAGAGERRFAYTYDSTTLSAGELEYEQWFTFKDYDTKNRFEFRHELEYGITDKLQVGAYLSDWRITKYDDGSSETEWRTAGFDVIYNLTHPGESFIGSALYGEVLIGPEKFALEGKLLLEKRLGRVVIGYNAILEAEWEGADYEEQVGVIENTFGVSYQINPSILIGFEGLHEIELAEWSDGRGVLYLGPNLSLRKNGFFVTAAGLFQTTEVSGEPDTQIRLLGGFHF